MGSTLTKNEERLLELLAEHDSLGPVAAAAGRLVIPMRILDASVLDVHHLRDGVYNATVSTGDERKSRRFVVQH